MLRGKFTGKIRRSLYCLELTATLHNSIESNWQNQNNTEFFFFFFYKKEEMGHVQRSAEEKQ